MNTTKTKERAEKARATRAAKAEQFAGQTIVIDDEWQIVRADDLNWEVQHKKRFFGYYPDVVSAFKALPAKMLSSTAKNSVADVVERQAGLIATIEKALRFKMA